MRTLVSLGPASGLSPPDTVEVQRRESTLALSRWKTRLAYVRSALDLLRAARGYDRVVLVTGGVELFVLAALLPRSKTLVAADWLCRRRRCSIARDSYDGCDSSSSLLLRLGAAARERTAGMTSERFWQEVLR